MDRLDEWQEMVDPFGEDDFPFPLPPPLFAQGMPKPNDDAWVDLLLPMIRSVIGTFHPSREQLREILESLFGPMGPLPPRFFSLARQKELINLLMARVFQPEEPSPSPGKKPAASPDQFQFDFGDDA